ncbi:MAG TPA: hypothetical protein VFX30_03775 [bacterium]|nr:hypothetical protein [bacterium]
MKTPALNPYSLRGLIDSLSLALPAAPIVSLKEALSGVVEAHDVLQSRAPETEIVPAMRAMTNSLKIFVGRDMGRIAATSWTLAASALYAAGRLALFRKESAQRHSLASELFQAIADFEAATYAAPEARRARHAVAADEHFLNDRYLGDTLLSLKGWLLPGALDFPSETALGRILSRLGIAGGAVRWPSCDVNLPNLAGAVRTFFDGGDIAMFRDAGLLPPLSYFEAAARWRGGSLGYVEMILASVLDEAPKFKRERVAAEAARLFPSDATVQRLHRGLEAAGSREEAVLRIFGELETWLGDASDSVSLPLFIQMALMQVH